MVDHGGEFGVEAPAIAGAALAAEDRVAGAVRRPDRLQDLVDGHRGRMSAVALDVTDTNRALGLVAEVVDEFGRIDVLVNNAGRTQVVALEETTDAERRDLSICTSSAQRR